MQTAGRDGTNSLSILMRYEDSGRNPGDRN